MTLRETYPVADLFCEGFRYFDTSRYASDFLRPCMMLLGHWHVHLHNLLDLLVGDAFLLNHLGHVHHLLLLHQTEQGSGPGQGQGLERDQSQLQKREQGPADRNKISTPQHKSKMENGHPVMLGPAS